MANDDKGRRKCQDISQDIRGDNNFAKGRFGEMRGGGGHRAPPRAIYTPGSGPLKKSGQTPEPDKTEREVNKQETQRPSSIQDRLKPMRFNRGPDQNQIAGGDNRMYGRQNNVDVSGDTNPRVSNRSNIAPTDPRRRRSKKPEQQLYVPKKVQDSLPDQDVANRSPMALQQSSLSPSPSPSASASPSSSGCHAGWERENSNWDNHPNRGPPNVGHGDSSGRQRSDDTNDDPRRRPDHHRHHHQFPHNQHHGKRYSGNRRNRHPNENEEREWRSISPMSLGNNANRRDYSREVRQGSEPLVDTANNGDELNRTRDTRSVDPPGYSEKFQRKPPSGRQGSGKMSSKIETLPPRFQRKYLAENGFDVGPPSGGGNSWCGRANQDWDGCTVTFQGSYGYDNPSSRMHDNFQPHSGWSNTIPARSRGRGRLRPEESEPPVGNFRSATPEEYSAASSRSHTPSQDLMTRSYERRGSNSTMYTSIESLSRVDQFTQAPGRFVSPVLPTHPPDCGIPCEPQFKRDYIPSRRPGSPLTNSAFNQQRKHANDNINSNINDNDNNITGNGKSNNNGTLQTSHNVTKSEEPVSWVSDMASLATLHWSEDVDIDDERDDTAEQRRNPSRGSSVASIRDKSSVSSRSGRPNGPPAGGGRNSGSRKKRRDRTNSGTIGDRSYSGDRRDDRDRGNSRERINNADNNFRNDDTNRTGRRHEPNRMRYRNSITHSSRESSRDRNYRGVPRNYEESRRNVDENWRTGKRTTVCDSDDTRGSSAACRILRTSNTNLKQSNNPQPPGVLVLPERHDVCPESVTPAASRTQSLQQQQQQTSSSPPQEQQQPRKTLFDPNNPRRPIIVRSPGNRVTALQLRDKESSSCQSLGMTPPMPLTMDSSPHMMNSFAACQKIGPSGGICDSGITRSSASLMVEQIQGNARPSWYDPCSGTLRTAKDPQLLLQVETIDRELQWLLSSGGLTANWDKIASLRESLKASLQILLETDIKFCQTENVEQHFWKILYYNMIEMLRKMMPKESGDSRTLCKEIMLDMIDEGTTYFENLLVVLENRYKFKLEVFLGSTSIPNGLGLLGLALVSAQKIFLFLGDLARYKEQANETTNYGKSRQWYLKAQQINPKNGRPYNQLALLAHYARRKLDAVYYYMRSLMASNPLHSARESLIALFDENRKKYESTERKRKEEREWKERARMKEKEGARSAPGGLRRETWVHPGDGRRVRRTTSSTASCEPKIRHSDSEELGQLTSVEINKRFITSYLHVHGKLITKIGMETFQEAAIQMLREFRTLLRHSPLPIPETRLLQLLALNMFAIDTTQLKDSRMEQGYRSELQERALIVSLQMFNLILERGVALLKCQFQENERHRLIVNEDMQVLLPAIKIWCDWMLCHTAVWNPPPSCTDYRVGPPGDSWSRLATMVNLVEKLSYSRQIVMQARDVEERENEVELIKLPEDTILSGFTPLMSNPQDPCYADKSEDMEVAQMCLRLQKILFFGEVFLCGLESPVLKLQKNESGLSEYVSVVEASSSSSPSSPPEQSDSELLVESYSEPEDSDTGSNPNPSRVQSTSESSSILDPSSAAHVPAGEIRSLIERKELLERRQRKQDRHRQRIQAILQKSTVSVDIQVRPRQLVPDTNCFIDYLPQLRAISRATWGTQPLYTLMIPLVVLNELEGLARGAHSRDLAPTSRAASSPEHIARVAEAAKDALSFARSRNPAIKCLTTRGTVLSSSTFTVEENISQDECMSNDDRILATCLSLCRSNNKTDEGSKCEEGEPRRLKRDVVLLTEDRNLRVKALARDVPVREIPDFVHWAGLG